MKVLLVSLSNVGGGASKVVYRLNNALIEKGINVELIIFSGTDQGNVTIFLSTKLRLFIFRLKNIFVRLIYYFFENPSNDYQSINMFPSKLLKYINSSDADVVNLHWVGAEMLSIKQISQINKKIVWTLHDAWPFNGSYHIDPDDYLLKNISSDTFHCLQGAGFLERYTASRKKKYLAQIPITFTSPSYWLKGKYDSSFFAKENTRCVVVPNFIDFTNWLPIEKRSARKKLKINSEKILLTFGASNATGSFNKGFRFIQKLMEMLPPLRFAYIIFGNEADHVVFDEKIEIYHMGFVSDEEKMRQIISAGDISVIPSMSESFSLLSLESIACNTPVLAFNTSGIRDIVKHKINGYLAEKFCADSLKSGIDWLVENSLTDISESVKCFSTETVIQQYIDLYDLEYRGIRKK